MINPLYQYLNDAPPTSSLTRLSLQHTFLDSSLLEHSFPGSTSKKTNHTLNAASTPDSSTSLTRYHASCHHTLVHERDKISGASRPLATIDNQDHAPLNPRCLSHKHPDACRLPSCQGHLEWKLQDAFGTQSPQGHSHFTSFVEGSQSDNIPSLRKWRESLPPSATSSRPTWRSLPRVPLQAQVTSLPAGYASHSFFHAHFQRPIALPPLSGRNYDNENLFPPSSRHYVDSEGVGGRWKEDVPASPPLPAPSGSSFRDFPALACTSSPGMMSRSRRSQDATVRYLNQGIPWSDEGEEDAYWTPSEGSEGSLHEARWSDGSEGSFHTPRWNGGSEGTYGSKWNEGNKGTYGSKWNDGPVRAVRWSEGCLQEFRWSEDNDWASQDASWSDYGFDRDMEEVERRHRERKPEEIFEDGIGTENRESNVAYNWLTAFWGVESDSSGGESLVVTAGRYLGRYLRVQRPASPLTCPATSLLPQVSPETYPSPTWP